MNKCVYLGVSSEPWRPTFERMGSSLGEVLYSGINLVVLWYQPPTYGLPTLSNA